MKNKSTIIAISSSIILFGAIVIKNFTSSLKRKKSGNEDTINMKEIQSEEVLNLSTVIGTLRGKKIIIEYKFPNAYEMIAQKNINRMAVTKVINKNNEFQTLKVRPETPIPLNIQVIYPAPNYQISKRKAQIFRLYMETPKIYQNVTMPYIQSFPQKSTKWVRDIVAGISEADKILLRKNGRDGFVLVPDEYYEEGVTNIQNAHFLALANDSQVKSIRDLRQSHLNMLLEIRKLCAPLIGKKLGVVEEEIVAFVHYFPTFFHFHVHFVHVNSPRPLRNVHLLDHIIQNLRMNANYYSEFSIPVFLGEKRHSKVIEGLKAAQNELCATTTNV